MCIIYNSAAVGVGRGSWEVMCDIVRVYSTAMGDGGLRVCFGTVRDLCFVCSGLLVVNVTWRDKTYVGALLDATKNEWAPPRSVLRNITPHSVCVCVCMCVCVCVCAVSYTHLTLPTNRLV